MVKLPEVTLKDIDFLWRLLKARPDKENISHKELPSWSDHCSFVASKPYKTWRIIVHRCTAKGAIYLTNDNFIGIHMLPDFQDENIMEEAVNILCKMYPGPFYANCAYFNHELQMFFSKIGFHQLQITYERE